MHDLTAKRTLVKSPPELWSELSEVDRLARHLDAFGEIKITKLEPEHTVAWEGEGASGTVSIEPSGWGTKVTLRAQLEGNLEAPPDERLASAAAALEPEVVETTAPDTAVDVPEADTDAVIEEPPVDLGTVEEPAHELAEESVAESGSSEPEPAEPAERAEPPVAPPRGRRGLLGWLFRPRTSAQETEAKREATTPEPVAASEPEPEPVGASEPEPVATSEPEPVAASDPEPEPIATSEPDPVAVSEAELVSEPDAADTPEGQARLDLEHAQAVLDEVLDTLGSAHHRPFSRG